MSLGISALGEGVTQRFSEPLRGWLQTTFLGNPLIDYLFACCVFAATWLAIWIFRNRLIHHLQILAERTAGTFDDFLIGEIRKIKGWFFAIVSFALAGHYLEFPEKVDWVLQRVLLIAVAIQGGLFLQRLIAYGMERLWAGDRGADPARAVTAKNLSLVIRWLLWGGLIVFSLNNLGFDVTAALTGLGIGGIAVAIAAQAILGDLFSSFSIHFDQPFRIGDFIVVGDLMGTVEHIGLKTTRIRSLSGEQLVFSNADLTSSRIRNFKRMQERRVTFRIGVTYQTSLEQCRRIPEMIQAIFQETPGIRLDRVHFASFGDSALLYEIVYFVLSPDYNQYMDLQQKINLALKERLERERIEFAYPTQTLYWVSQTAEPPAATTPSSQQSKDPS